MRPVFRKLTNARLHTLRAFLYTQGIDRANGGHMYTSGSVSIAGAVNFRQGFSRGDVSRLEYAVGYCSRFSFISCLKGRDIRVCAP